MRATVQFVLNDRPVELSFTDSEGARPTTTVLNYLRSLPGHRGVKEGCAEGDCGACTVMLGERLPDASVAWRAVDSCLFFLPMLDGKHLLTVEHLAEAGLHPVQRAMVGGHGSQCGYCTPGFIMSVAALAEHSPHPSREEIERALAGNLCRCTGYRPIIEAAAAACAQETAARAAREVAWPPRESLHIETARQRYFRPASLPEAVALRHRHLDAVVVAGATDVALRVTKQHEIIPAVLDCSNVEELKSVRETPGGLVVGAGVSLETLARVAAASHPACASMLEVFGSRQIRSVATLAGNLATASPIGDMITVLIAHGASVTLESLNGRRTLAVEAFITGYRTTALRPDELITSVLIPRPAGIIRAYKVSKRRELDISTLSAAFRLELGSGGIVTALTAVYGGMDSRVRRAPGVERFMAGKRWVREVVEEASKLLDAEFHPLTDVRGSAAFRRVAARNALIKFWSETALEER